MSWAKMIVGWGQDAAVQKLSVEAKLLFVLGFTHSGDASLIGLSRVGYSKMTAWLGAGEPAGVEIVERSLDELAVKPLALYDFDHQLLWIVNRVKHINTTEAWAEGAARALSYMPPSPLVDAWRDMYGGALPTRERTRPRTHLNKGAVAVIR